MRTTTPDVVTLSRRLAWVSLIGALLALPFSAFASGHPAVDRRDPRQSIPRHEVLEAEQLLSALGYWTGPVDGVFDSGSRHALVAFQKVEDRKRTGKLTTGELQALRTALRPVPKETGFAHVEVDLKRQVLFVVDDNDVVTHVLPVSTGNEKLYTERGKVQRAHTPRGSFTVQRKIRGIRISPLGFLYYPNYIYGGIAIHGSWSIPVYADSHGCIRIPMFAAKEFSSLAPVGTEVIVY